MFEAAALLFLSAETPLHAGTGSSLGIVDLPIQRERTTQYPMIQGSSIKGALRTLARRSNLAGWEFIFGPETGNAQEYAGAVGVGDARILLFPVRSLKDVYVYATSANVLARFQRDCARSGHMQLPELAAPGEQEALMTSQGGSVQGDMLILEEWSFRATVRPEVGAIADAIGQQICTGQEAYWLQKLRRAVVVLPEDDFRDFVLYSTEIVTRVRLNSDKKTVEDGALWTEEHLPSETVLYAPIMATSTRAGSGDTLMAAEVIQRVRSIATGYMQLGGDETVGRGIVRTSWQVLASE